MKKIFVFIFLINSLFLCSQEAFDNKVNNLKSKIAKFEGGDKLKLLDSLNKLVLDKSEYQYDSIARATIAYAIKLDSINHAGKHIADLIFYYANISEEPELGIELFREFEQLNLNLSNDSLLFSIYLYTGHSYLYSGKLKESIPFYNKSQEIALKINDSIAYALAKSSKASVLLDTGNYAQASKMLSESAKIFRTHQDTTRLIYVKATLSVLYSKMGFYEEAKKERQEVIDISFLQKNYGSLQANLLNVSVDAERSGDQKLRIESLKKAYKYGLMMHGVFRLKPTVSYELLRAYADNDSLIKAKMYYEKIQEDYASRAVIPNEYYYRLALASYYGATNNHKKSLIEAKAALKLLLEINDVDAVYEVYNTLSNIYKELNDFENAYIYETKHNKLKDSINSLQKTRVLTYYQTLYETEKRDFKIAEQASEISVLDAENKMNKQWMLFGGIGLLALFTIVYLLRSQKYVNFKQLLLEQFSQDLISEQEKERTRLAQELHDSVGQKLMLLSKVTKNIGSNDAENLASTTLEEVRNISRGLHPSNIECLGLTEAINALVYSINANTDLFFTEEIANIDDLLPKEFELHLYRIIQETLNNIVKHSKAKAVKMHINIAPKNITVVISDNGKGFDFEIKQKSISLGLKTLFERAKIIGAQMNFDSERNKGTKMSLIIPI